MNEDFQLECTVGISTRTRIHCPQSSPAADNIFFHNTPPRGMGRRADPRYITYRGEDANFGRSGLSLKRFTIVIGRAISRRSIPSEARNAYRRYRNCGIFRGPANRFSIIARRRAPPSAIAKAIEGKMLARVFTSGNS